jgi:hypothetical protein
MGRFINADALVSTGQGILGNNMFAYCGNNPVLFSDYSGHTPNFSMHFFDDSISTPDDFAAVFSRAAEIGTAVSLSEGVISLDMLSSYEDIRELSKYFSLSYLCDVIAIYACKAYEDEFGEAFLLSDACVSYEIREHIKAYYYAVGDCIIPNFLVIGYTISNIANNRSYGKTIIYSATKMIDMREVDVKANAGIASQAFAFNYRYGIRDEYVGTVRDPWANTR